MLDLILSLNRNYKCVNDQCIGRYDPKQPIIDGGEGQEDSIELQQNKYTVWLCPCGRENLIVRTSCTLCSSSKPEDALTFGTDETPPSLGLAARAFQWAKSNSNPAPGSSDANSYLKWLESENPKDYPLNVIKYESSAQTMGVILDGNSYPVLNQPVIAKLHFQFGDLYRNSCIFPFQSKSKLDAGQRAVSINNGWNTDIPSMALSISSHQDHDEGVLLNSRCIAFNEENGRIATIESKCGVCILNVFRPNGHRFECEANNAVNLGPDSSALDQDGSMSENHRLRFVGDMIYILHYGTKKIYCYNYDSEYKTLTLVDTLFDEYFEKACVVDFLVVKRDAHEKDKSDLLFVLFNNWIGIYTIYPELVWYHVCCFTSLLIFLLVTVQASFLTSLLCLQAVSYSKRSVKASSLEMCYHDDWENRMNDPLEREWMNDMIRNQKFKLARECKKIFQMEGDILKLEVTSEALHAEKSNLNLKNDYFYKEKAQSAKWKMQRSKEKLLTVNDEQWSQMTDIGPYGSMQLMVSMSAILTLLGHQIDSKSWKSIRSVLVAENADIKSKMIQFNAWEITLERCVMVQSIDGFADLDADKCMNGIDQLTAILIRWITSHIEYAAVHQQYGKNDVVTALGTRLQIVNQQITEQTEYKDKLVAQKNRGSCRVE